jgi:hypothetical protein
MSKKTERENINKIKKMRSYLHQMETTMEDWIVKELIGSIEECLDIIEERIMSMQE